MQYQTLHDFYIRITSFYDAQLYYDILPSYLNSNLAKSLNKWDPSDNTLVIKKFDDNYYSVFYKNFELVRFIKDDNDIYKKDNNYKMKLFPNFYTILLYFTPSWVWLTYSRERKHWVIRASGKEYFFSRPVWIKPYTVIDPPRAKVKYKDQNRLRKANKAIKPLLNYAQTIIALKPKISEEEYLDAIKKCPSMYLTYEIIEDDSLWIHFIYRFGKKVFSNEDSYTLDVQQIIKIIKQQAYCLFNVWMYRLLPEGKLEKNAEPVYLWENIEKFNNC